MPPLNIYSQRVVMALAEAMAKHHLSILDPHHIDLVRGSLGMALENLQEGERIDLDAVAARAAAALNYERAQTDPNMSPYERFRAAYRRGEPENVRPARPKDPQTPQAMIAAGYEDHYAEQAMGGPVETQGQPAEQLAEQEPGETKATGQSTPYRLFVEGYKNPKD